MAASMATMAMILRSIATAPVGGPRLTGGRGWATRAAYHSTAPRMTSRKTAVNSAGRLLSMAGVRLGNLGRRRDRVGRVGQRARDGLRRPRLDGDLARAVDL